MINARFETAVEFIYALSILANRNIYTIIADYFHIPSPKLDKEMEVKPAVFSI
jgi:hypothetical protein